MTEKELFSIAEAQRSRSYSVYSGFSVGAALETDTGEIFRGCNVENVSYGCTICAERAAVFAAVSAGFRHFRRIAIAGGKSDTAAHHTPCSPCGACLQVLAEFSAPDFEIILADGRHFFSEFMPLPFSHLQ